MTTHNKRAASGFWRFFADLSNSLATAELNLVIATLFRSSGPQLEIFESDESDVIQAHDFLIPLPRLDTKGFRVLVN